MPIKLIKRKNFHLLLSTPRLMWFLIQIQAYICMYTYKCICIRVLPEPSAIFTSDFLLFIIHLFNFYTLIACIYIYIYIYSTIPTIYILYIYIICYICTGVVHGLFVCWKFFHYYDIPCLPPQHLSWLIFVMPCWLTDCQTTNACSYFIIWYLFCTHCYPLITSFILSIQGQLFCFIEFLPYIYIFT